MTKAKTAKPKTKAVEGKHPIDGDYLLFKFDDKDETLRESCHATNKHRLLAMAQMVTTMEEQAEKVDMKIPGLGMVHMGLTVMLLQMLAHEKADKEGCACGKEHEETK